MPYSTDTYPDFFARLLAFISIVRTRLDSLLIPFYTPLTSYIQRADLSGKLAIVTGANSGIGFEVARALAGMGAQVVLACRNEVKGEQARRRIVESTGNEKVEMEVLDCASFDSVGAFLERWNKRQMKRVDILINNAGGLTGNVAFTHDGFEQTYQSNHLAHVLLTHTLLNQGHMASDARIISVSSAGFYDSPPLDEQVTTGSDVLSRYDNEAGRKISFLDMMRLYRRSKAAQVVWTMALQRRLAKREGWKGITVHSCHPGEFSTTPGVSSLRRMVDKIGISNEEGAAMPVWLAVVPEPASEGLRGMYWDRMQWKWVWPWSLNIELQDRLWDKWCADAGVDLR